MLHMALNISWMEKLTDKDLYQRLPQVTEKIRKRMKLAGHCVRHTEEVASDIVLWESLDGYTSDLKLRNVQRRRQPYKRRRVVRFRIPFYTLSLRKHPT